MKAVVVYQSLWGSTAAIGKAIAEGIGKGAIALTTSEATAEVLAGADLVVAGAPVHAFSLPSEETLKSAQAKPVGKSATPADVSHLLMRTWLRRLEPVAGTAAAAYDTRVKGPLGRGGATKIAKELKKAGYRTVAEAKGFRVAFKPEDITVNGMLLEGEIERARAWGESLRKALG